MDLDIEKVDQLCDRFEERLKRGERITADEFIEQEDLPRDGRLLEFLRPLQQEYVDTPRGTPVTPGRNRGIPDRGGRGHGASDRRTSAGSFEPTQAPGKGDSDDFDFAGQVIGDYQLHEKLGEGGMGVVYKARHLELDRIVAVKMIIAGKHAQEGLLKRFQIEAEAAARLNHPNIVGLYDVGKHEGVPYFSSEFVDGPTLSKLLVESAMEPRRAAQLMEPIARATQSLHEHDIVHRDLKPQNILIARASSQPKIADFGLAKLLDEGRDDMTATGMIVGTPGFMSPEQARGDRDIGPSTDVYSLGAVMYAMLTGNAPFKAATPLETIKQVVAKEPVSPSRMQPTLPKDLETICLKCLRKEPAQRYETAAAFADDLERFLEGRPIQARPISLAEKAWLWCRREPKIASLLGLAASLMLILTIGGYVLAALLNHQKQEIVTQKSEIESLAESLDAEASLKTQMFKQVVYGLDKFFSENPVVQPLRQDLLATIEEKIEDTYLPGGEDDFRASLLRHQGEMFLLAGATKQAMEKFMESEAIAKKLHEKGELIRPSLDFGTLDKWIGKTLQEQGKYAEAEKRFRSLIQNRKAYFAESVGKKNREGGVINESHRLGNLANANGMLGVVLLRQKKYKEAEKYINAALTERKKIYEQNPDDFDAMKTYAGTLGVLVEMHEILGNLEEMDAALLKQVELLSKVAEKSPVSENLMNLAMPSSKLGKSKLLLGENTVALKLLSESDSAYSQLMKNPFVPSVFRFNAAEAAMLYGIAIEREGGDPEEKFDRSVEIYDALIEQTNNRRQINSRMLVQARTAQSDNALNLADQYAKGSNREHWLYAALTYGIHAGRVPDQEQKSAFAAKSFELIRRAIRSGYGIPFAVLRGNDLDFAELMKLEGYAEMLDEEEARLRDESE